MKLWAIVGEGEKRHERDLEVQVEGGRIFLESDGEKIAADVVPLPDGESYSLLVDGRSYEVAIEEDATGIRVTLGGKTFAALVRSPLEKVLREVRHAAPADAGRKLVAPMPGLVVAIKVAPGDTVTAGTPLLIMEAMKMQNELAAEAAGVVEQILVAPRQSVESGQTLITLGAPR
jgi:glutaconyl-CoA/methylmalonyl-CoA decarboxylase subunit gamma